MNLRILIHGINYSPELTGIGKYTGEMAAWLASRGHSVRVVTAPPYYPEWRVGDGYSSWRYRREPDASTESAGNGGKPVIYRCPLWVPADPSGFKRLLHLASFALSGLPVMIGQAFWRPDVVMLIEPTLLCAPQAWLTARLAGARCWLHIQDFEVDAAFELGLLPQGRLRKLAQVLEGWLLRRFDRVSAISRRMLERAGAKAGPGARCVLFPNWVDVSAIHPLEEPGALRRRLGVGSDVVVALYSGNMGAKQGLEILLHAARRLSSESKIRFVFCGEGAARKALADSAKGLSNVVWLPLQPVESLNELLNAADIHLLPQRADAADLVMPSKLTGMLASGRPVVATAAAGTQLAEAVAECGITVAPGDAEAFALSILRLAGDPARRKEYGRAARARAVATLDRDAVLGRLETELVMLVRRS